MAKEPEIIPRAKRARTKVQGKKVQKRHTSKMLGNKPRAKNPKGT